MKKDTDSRIGNILEAIRSREDVGSAKKGVNLLSIVQKLTEKRGKQLEKAAVSDSN